MSIVNSCLLWLYLHFQRHKQTKINIIFFKINVGCTTWSGVMQGPGGSTQCPSPGGPDECPITPTYKEMQVVRLMFI